MPKPGTDGALAMGIIAALIENGHVDREWVEKHTVGFPELAARAAEFTPDYVERVTGVAAQDVASFAREFATIQPSVIRLGVALERHAGGGQTIRAVCAIPALAGSWRHVGGGLLQMPLWEFPVDWARVSRPDFIRPGTRVVNNLQLGRALVGDMKLDPPVMGLYIYNTNPVSQAPETNKIVQGLAREDLFFVTAEHFVTDTAAYADIVLPATMAGEHDDMMFSWGHFYLTINEQAIEPCGEAKSNAEIFRLLAAGMGYRRSAVQDERHGARRALCPMGCAADGAASAWTISAATVISISPSARPTTGCRMPKANSPTPSGKVEFLVKDAKNFVAPPFRMMYEEMQSGEDVDPLPGYVPPRESAATNPRLAERYPLNVISPKSHGFLNSCYANEKHKIKGQGEQFVHDQPEGRGRAEHPRGRSGARL